MQQPFNFVFNFVFVWMNAAALHVSAHDLHACLYTSCTDVCVYMCVCGETPSHLIVMACPDVCVVLLACSLIFYCPGLIG